MKKKGLAMLLVAAMTLSMEAAYTQLTRQMIRKNFPLQYLV